MGRSTWCSRMALVSPSIFCRRTLGSSASAGGWIPSAARPGSRAGAWAHQRVTPETRRREKQVFLGWVKEVRDLRDPTSHPPEADLPYADASVRHIVGTGRGGGYEWHAKGHAVPRGAAGLELDEDGKINSFTTVWDGSLLDHTAIKTAAAHAVDS